MPISGDTHDDNSDPSTGSIEKGGVPMVSTAGLIKLKTAYNSFHNDRRVYGVLPA